MDSPTRCAECSCASCALWAAGYIAVEVGGADGGAWAAETRRILVDARIVISRAGIVLALEELERVFFERSRVVLGGQR